MNLTVHCPGCGGAIEVPVQVRSVDLSRAGRRVEVFLQERTVDHVCLPPPGSTEHLSTVLR